MQSNVTIYYNPLCSKSRATLQLLEDKNIQPNIIDYMADPPDKETLQKIIKLLGGTARDLLRSHEQVFKDAGLDDSDLEDDDILDALSQCPTLLQRPIVVVNEEKAAMGRPPENVLSIID